MLHRNLFQSLCINKSEVKHVIIQAYSDKCSQFPSFRSSQQKYTNSKKKKKKKAKQDSCFLLLLTRIHKKEKSHLFVTSGQALDCMW